MGTTHAKPEFFSTATPIIGSGAQAGWDAQTLRLLQESSRELTSILEREELLRRIAQRVKPLIDYHLFSVLLWNEQAQYLEHVFSLRYGQRLEQKHRLRLGEGLNGTAALLRQPVRVGDVGNDPRYLKCSPDEKSGQVRSELVVPLLFQDRLVGLVDLESTDEHAFSEEHEYMLAALAPYIAIGLENARLYEQVHENERRLEEELSTAREIQRRLLPATAPATAGADIGVGYVPAHQLGGDFYDFPAYGEGRLALAVGDVSGKGTAAALYGALAVGVLREHVAEHPCPPAEMLAHMNERLHQPAMKARYVASLFAVYDPARRSLRLANAGFPRPLLLRSGQVHTIFVQGVPLGLLPGTTYDELELALEPGDLLVFASDGILEAMDREEEEFGSARLGRMLAELAETTSAQAVADEILRSTDRHAADNGGPSDDRTVVVLRIREDAGAIPNPAQFPMMY